MPTPIAKTRKTMKAWNRSSPWLAAAMAAPRVGPTHGVQTRPSNRPIRNCPPSPSPLTFPSVSCARFVIGAATAVSDACSFGTRSTSPAASNNAPANILIPPSSMPSWKPNAMTMKPKMVKDKPRPAAKASGPCRCLPSEDATRIGISGNTQGLSMVTKPARKARANSPPMDILLNQLSVTLRQGLLSAVS